MIPGAVTPSSPLADGRQLDISAHRPSLWVDAADVVRLVPPTRSVSDGLPGAEPVPVRVLSRFAWRLLDERVVLPLDMSTRHRIERYERWFPLTRWVSELLPLVPVACIVVWIVAGEPSPRPLWWFLILGVPLIARLSLDSVISPPRQMPKRVKGRIGIVEVHPFAFQEWLDLNPWLLPVPRPDRAKPLGIAVVNAMSRVFGRPGRNAFHELELLEPVGFLPGEGGWQVRLDERGTGRTCTVVSRSFDVDTVRALHMIGGDLPRVLVSDATEGHARELVDRLHRTESLAVAVPPATPGT
jgi:hypothetical protein